MSLEDYQKALRLGLKGKKEAEEQGRQPGLVVLEQPPEKLAYSRETLGILEIPINLIVGTCTALRAESFSPDFYPVFQAETEFAIKWMKLCAMHLDEGIRDPVQVVEYLNRYYVIEGHKRISVLKYFGAVSIYGHVTRLIPYPSDDPEVKAYREFLQFYQLTGQLSPVFRKPGLYPRLMSALGLKEEVWSAEQNYQFRSFFHMFCDVMLRCGYGTDSLDAGFLTYVEIFGYEESVKKLPSQMEVEVGKISREIRSCVEGAGSTVMLVDQAKPPLISVLRQSRVKVAFVHDDSASTSNWTYHQEYGRYRMASAMRDEVDTISYENANNDQLAIEMMEDAVKQGAKIIFTTRSTLLLPSVQEAVLHPEVKILNCSLNVNYPSVRTYYPRLYGAKFIKGVIAGTLAQDDRIGYVTDYPTYGSIANVNAFAQGVHMVNAKAKVYLEWSQLQQGDGLQRLYDQGIRLIDYRDQLGEYTGMSPDQVHNLALIQCHWNRFYQSLIRRVMTGSWKQENQQDRAVNYWWGMTQGMVSVYCSRRVTSGTRRLVGILREALRSRKLDAFYGTLYDQLGNAVVGEDTPMTAQQIMTMNWLSSLVVGRLPQPEEFTPKAQELIRLQGLEKWELT